MMTVQSFKALLDMSNPEAVVVIAKDKLGSSLTPSGLVTNGAKFDSKNKVAAKHGISCVIIYPEE